MTEYKNLDENEALKLSTMLVAYMQTCHNNGRVHEVFGLKDVLFRNNKATVCTPTTTLHFMSPELRREYSTEGNMYTIGCIMYELVAPEFVGFDHSSGDEQIEKYVTTTIGSLVSHNYIDLVLAAIKTNPQVRITANDLLMRLKTLIGETTDAACAETAPSTPTTLTSSTCMSDGMPPMISTRHHKIHFGDCI